MYIVDITDTLRRLLAVRSLHLILECSGELFDLLLVAEFSNGTV